MKEDLGARKRSRDQHFEAEPFFGPAGRAGRREDEVEPEEDRSESEDTPLDEAPKKLAYGGERQVTRRAQKYLQEHEDF